MTIFLPKVKRKPSTGERFANAFSSAANSAAKEIPEYYLGQEEEKKKKEEKDLLAKQKNYAKVRSAAKSGLSLYDKNKAFDPEMTGRLEELMHSYIDQGFSPDEAFTHAFGEITSAGQAGKETEPESTSIFSPSKRLGASGKPISDLGESLKGYPEAASRQLAQFGRKYAGAAQGLSDIHHQDKTSPVQGLAPHGRETLPNDKSNILSFYDKIVGEKGVPRNTKEKIASGAAFGPSGLLGEAAEVGLEKAGLPEWAQHLGNIGVMLLSQAGFSRFAKGTEALKKAADISKRTGIPADDIIKGTGVDLAKVAAGDEAAISELSQKITESPAVSKKVKETPKSVYNKEAAAREREVFGQKLPESPLEEHYRIRDKKISDELSKRPETKARDLEIRERLKPEETNLFEDLRSEKDKLTSIGRERIKANPSESERVNALYEYQQHKIDTLTDKLKDVQYEMKYGRPRPTEAEIDAQIAESVQKYVDAIENPSENLVDANRQIQLDRKYLDRAAKLIERGELPGELRPDTFMKMKKKYLDGYNAAIQKNEQIVDALKGAKDAASIRKAHQSKELIDSLKPRIKRLESDLINQTDNIKAMRALEKPSGAFYKQQIKGVRKDLERFDYDLFKQKRIKNPTEMKAQKAFKEHASDIEKGRELAKNPTKESIKEAAESSGITQEQAFKEVKAIKEATKPVEKAIKTGTVTPNTVPNWINAIKRNAPRLSKGFAGGIAIELIGQEFGIKVDNAILRGTLALLSTKFNPGVVVGKELTSWIYDHAQAAYLKRLRGNVREWNKYLSNIEKKNGKAKKNRILKLANED